MNHSDITRHNQSSWDLSVQNGCLYTVPVSADVIARAKQGIFSVILTPQKSVPAEWLGDVRGKNILCLACGGGQQAPVLAAAGGLVTVLDLSERQLDQDRTVARLNQLDIRIEQGDMTDLSRFDSDTFDLIFHPVSNSFVKDVLPVWKECWRVLKPGGCLLAGFTNPMVYIFDEDQMNKGHFQVRHRLPYNADEILTSEEKHYYSKTGKALEYSHTFETQIGGQLNCGFQLLGFYEDSDPAGIEKDYFPGYFATRALKPRCP